ncbi:acyltransferase [Pseudescherichia sp.]|uniref:acyltransferase family protein n=1 Tax=Pseudescherichia sp. TaxID=2055881 RepID=UPI00289FD348|nr:acyltransferase [Pseudescherichia sp.]
MLPQNQLLIWMMAICICAPFILNLSLFSFIDKENRDRSNQVDGLRFFLSIFVVFHHFVLSYTWFTAGDWSLNALNPWPVNKLAGGYGVVLFFIISGFLFANVKTSGTGWVIFYTKRVFRIGPMFFFSSIIVILITIFLQRDNLVTQGSLSSLLHWFDMGITGIKPDILGGQNSKLLNAGVTWTLYWEWVFYFSLPLVVLIKRKVDNITFILAFLFICCYLSRDVDLPWIGLVAFFAIGFLCRELVNYVTIKKIWLDICAVISLIVCIFSITEPFALSSVPLFGMLFFCICCGADIFGLLRFKGIVRLGEVSYSIYLIHGMFWFVMNKIFFKFFSSTESEIYMTVATITILLMIVTSAFTYRYIELPFIKLGHKLPKSLGKPVQQHVSQSPADGHFSADGAELNSPVLPLSDSAQTLSARPAS